MAIGKHYKSGPSSTLGAGFPAFPAHHQDTAWSPSQRSSRELGTGSAVDEGGILCLWSVGSQWPGSGIRG